MRAHAPHPNHRRRPPTVCAAHKPQHRDRTQTAQKVVRTPELTAKRQERSAAMPGWNDNDEEAADDDDDDTSLFPIRAALLSECGGPACRWRGAGSAAAVGTRPKPRRCRRRKARLNNTQKPAAHGANALNTALKCNN